LDPGEQLHSRMGHRPGTENFGVEAKAHRMTETRDADKLVAIHTEIDYCRVCESQVIGFEKPVGLIRGDSGVIMVIGQGPGRSELKRLRAFAGQSGKTLEKWLIACGADPSNPRLGIYFTSIVKCFCPTAGREHDEMVERCFPFLRRQLEAVRPELVITLGRKSYEVMRFNERSFEQALCVPLRASEEYLISPHGFDFTLLPWPHPSGLNRWLNEESNRSKLQGSFSVVSDVLARNR
jgi:uracil-DNA glycosylase family 4